MTVRIRIEKRGLYGQDGPIPVGTELTLPEEPKAWAGRYTVLSDSKGKTAVTNPTDGARPPVGPFTVKDDGKGWFSIRDAADAKVGKALREGDAKAFETLSADDQAAFAAEHAKA